MKDLGFSAHLRAPYHLPNRKACMFSSCPQELAGPKLQMGFENRRVRLVGIGVQPRKDIYEDLLNLGMNQPKTHGSDGMPKMITPQPIGRTIKRIRGVQGKYTGDVATDVGVYSFGAYVNKTLDDWGVFGGHHVYGNSCPATTWDTRVISI